MGLIKEALNAGGVMEEILQTQLPVLAWRWHEPESRYELIYDDLPVGEIQIDDQGGGQARYHDRRWQLQPDANGTISLFDQSSRILRGRLSREATDRSKVWAKGK